MQILDTQVARQWGLPKAIWAAIMRRVRPWFMLARVTVREIKPMRLDGELGDGLVMRQATSDDLLAAVDDSPDQFSLSFVEAALDRGDVCAAAFDRSRMVAWTWASLGSALHGDGMHVRVEAPYEHGYKSYTKPEYRNRGIIARLSLLRDQMAVELGCTRFIGFAETHNYVSIHSNRRLGSRLVGYAGYFRLFGRSFPFRTPGVAKHTFRFVRS
jgi:GNAT superfamily N-acetyltransferase